MKLTADLDATLDALADPTRRAILERLGGGGARVTDLAAPFAMSLNSVSKHLRVLERAGLVRRQRAGREHFIVLDRAPLEAAAVWIARQRDLWTTRLVEFEAWVEAEQVGGSGHGPGAGLPAPSRTAILRG